VCPPTTVDRDGVRRGPEVGNSPVGIGLDRLVERADEPALEFGVDLFERPGVFLGVLHPLQVRDGHAAGVREDVGYYWNIAFGEDVVRSGRRRPVRRLDDDAGFEVLGDFGRDDVRDRRRDHHVDVEGEQRVVGDLRRVGIAVLGEVPTLLDVLGQADHVEPVGIVQAAADVARGDDVRAPPCEQSGRPGSDVSEALDRHGRVVDRLVQMFEQLLGDDRNAPPRGLHSAGRPADLDGFPGDDLRDGIALVDRVRVHHPGHYLWIRIHVRRGDIDLGPDHPPDPLGVPAGESFEFVPAQLLRIAGDPAFRPAVRQVH